MGGRLLLSAAGLLVALVMTGAGRVADVWAGLALARAITLSIVGAACRDTRGAVLVANFWDFAWATVSGCGCGCGCFACAVLIFPFAAVQAIAPEWAVGDDVKCGEAPFTGFEEDATEILPPAFRATL